VIDKDAASALLAAHLEADVLVISTGVDKVAVNLRETRAAQPGSYHGCGGAPLHERRGILPRAA
jgi:hypothetical protein